MLHIGQKVICIDDNFSNIFENQRKHMTGFPVRGCIYTIRGFYTYNVEKLLVAYLDEIINPIHMWPSETCECGFDVRRFKPLIKSEFDLSIFQQITIREKELV